MNQNEILIDQIALHSRGIPEQVTRAAVEGLGPEIMANLAQQGLVQSGQAIQLGDLNLGTLNLPGVKDANELRREIARCLTRAIATRIRRK